MDSRAVIDDLLTQIGTLSGNPFSLNEEGVCEMSFEDLKLAVSVPEKGDSVLFFSFFSPIPEKGQRDLYEKLLKLNLLGSETNGARFAISEKENSIVLVYSHLVEPLDFTQFTQILKNFIAVSQKWQQTFTQGEMTPPSKDSGQDDLLKNLKYRI